MRSSASKPQITMLPVADGQPRGVAGVEQYAALAANSLGLRVRLASHPVSRLLVRERLVIGYPGDADITLVTPTRAPAVPHDPVVLRVPNRLHTMIQGRARTAE